MGKLRKNNEWDLKFCLYDLENYADKVQFACSTYVGFAFCEIKASRGTENSHFRASSIKEYAVLWSGFCILKSPYQTNIKISASNKSQLMNNFGNF